MKLVNYGRIILFLILNQLHNMEDQFPSKFFSKTFSKLNKNMYMIIRPNGNINLLNFLNNFFINSFLNLLSSMFTLLLSPSLRICLPLGAGSFHMTLGIGALSWDHLNNQEQGRA